MKSISYSAFFELLKQREIEGKTSAEFSLILTKTSPKLLKKSRVTGDPCPYKSVSKFSKSFTMLNVIYERSYNKELEKLGFQEKGENLFTAEPLPWGHWLTLENGKTSKVLIKHGEEIYIRSTFNTRIKPETTWEADGVEVKKEDLKDYLPEDRENLVEVRTFKLSSIKTIHLSGEIYNLE